MLMLIIHCIIQFQGTLPLAKLCAMVTMKRKGEANLQTFSLPLSPHTTALKSREDTEKVSIKYILHKTFLSIFYLHCEAIDAS